MSRIACPYCCTIQTFPDSNICNKCGNAVPEKYIRAARMTPPVYLAVVGMSSHGKTTYIHSLTHAMDNLGKIVRGSFLDALDDKTIDELRKIRGQISTQTKTTATAPRSNEENLLVPQEPMVFSLKSFMTMDRNSLVIYDIAGESFSNRADIQQYADPLKLAYTIWFMVSLYDLEHPSEKMTDRYGTIADLFNIYIAGMERVGANPRGRKLHVVYTKADKLTNRLNPDIRDYIRSDAYSNLADKSPQELRDKPFNVDNYFYQLEQMSARLREFTEDEVPGGIQFVNMVEDYGMELSFSINTAIGRDHTPNNQMIDYEAYRVLDPLVWALKENVELGPQAVDKVGPKAGKEKEIILILDTGQSSLTKIYGQQMNLPSHFFTALSDLGEVKTYHLGTITTLLQPGREPLNASPTKETLPFIGPILDQVGEDSQILLLTCRTVEDMLDFHTPDWHQRMAVVTFEQPYEVRRNDLWPRNIVYDRSRTPADQVKEIVKKLFYKPL